MFDLHGRVAVVTGASSGLGLQMAIGFAKQGADLVIMARRIEKLEKEAEKIRSLGVRCLPIQCDVTDTDAVNKAAEEAYKFYGKIDILVNNAGSSKNAGVLAMTDEEWDFTMQTDLTSVFKVTRAFSNYMVKNKYGRIINIASIYGEVGNTAMDTVAYHSSKGGVVNFTRAVAAELAKYNITCNAISPGYFETELTVDTLKTESFTKYMETSVPLKRYGHEGELNPAAIFLASDEASYVTGQNIKVDGGYTAV
ncbi:MAG TPA: SDR family oxidoreductase [Candidatus Merdenecus merdavium]|nr:SDR family oxidoreductase [Candidatus Merdenecus merdavium]